MDLLPASLLGNIIDYLSLTETRRLLILDHQLHRQMPEIESHRTVLHLAALPERLALRNPTNCAYWSRVVDLDLGDLADNALLNVVARHMKALQLISLVGSTDVSLLVSDEEPGGGLRSLARLENVRYMDLTFCHNVFYRDVLSLQDEYANSRKSDDDNNNNNNILVIRRQPAWMDGLYQTPFPNDAVRRYWPDGAFEYERERLNRGFVKKIEKIRDNPYHVKVKIQYSNSLDPMVWLHRRPIPVIREFSLLFREQKSQSKSVQSVLFAYARGLRAPDEHFPNTEHWALPIETDTHIPKVGERLSCSVAHIPVFPLDQAEPPRELVETNREFLQLHPDVR